MKFKKLRDLLIEKNLEGLWLKTNKSFSWLFNGRGWISVSHEKSCGSVLITRDNIYFITDNIESERLRKEENVGIKIIEHMWFEKDIDIVKDLVNIKKVGSDFGIGMDLSEEIKKIRMKLEEEDIKRYKKDGEIIMEIFEKTLINISPLMTEWKVAGNIYRDLRKEGYISYVVLVFSDRSRKEYRHNLPRNIKIGDKGFASICSTNGGPIVSMTRAFSFVNDKEYINQHKINAELEARIINETKVGLSLSQMFQKIKELYENMEYGKEFYLHHQGGIIGYDTRESIALPDNNIIIEDKMAFCWNPTITGTKSEDTFVINNGKKDFISWNKNSIWPILKYEINDDIINRPGVMILD